MNDERDPLDDALGHGLRALAPSEFELDADSALGSMRPALQRARARRRLAVTTSVLGALVVVVGGAALLQRQPNDRIDIQGRPQPTVTTAVLPRSSTTTTPTSTSKPPGVTPTNTTPTKTADTPGTTEGNGGSGPQPSATTTPTTRDQPSVTTTTRAAPASTKTYSTTGGGATIRFAGGRLTLVSHAPAAGYTADIRKNSPSEIEIRFSNDDNESRIRVRVQDGQLRPEVED